MWQKRIYCWGFGKGTRLNDGGKSIFSTYNSGNDEKQIFQWFLFSREVFIAFFPSSPLQRNLRRWCSCLKSLCYRRQCVEHTCSFYIHKIAIKNYVLWKGILPFAFFSLSSFFFDECLKTQMSLFFHFLLFYDTIDDEKKARKSSIRKYVRNERMKKSLKIMRKQFFCVHACWESLMYSPLAKRRNAEEGKNQYSLCFSTHIRWFGSLVNHHRNLYQCLKSFFGDVDAYYRILRMEMMSNFVFLCQLRQVFVNTFQS